MHSKHIMNRIEIKSIFTDDNVVVLGAPTDRIKGAIQDMSVEYDELTFVGHMDGHHFCIERVINDRYGEDLTAQEICEMFYIAHGPECISISDFED